MQRALNGQLFSATPIPCTLCATVTQVKSKIDAMIAENGVMMFSQTTCPFCKRAKGVLNQLGAKYNVIELDQVPDGNAMRVELGKMTGRTSAPNVFISGRTIGGCSEGPGVVPLHERGELVPLLKAASAL